MRASKARGFGRKYWQLLWGYHGPHVEAGWTNETAPPYRYGQCLVHRLWRLPVALVIGRWEAKHHGPAHLRRMLADPWTQLEDPANGGPLTHAVTELPRSM